MSELLKLLRIEHDFEHEMVKRQFSLPKIYHGGDSYDLSKRWYVYYAYRNPLTDRMQRQENVYILNQKQKGIQQRLRELKTIQQRTTMLLKKGFSPYHDPITKKKYTVKGALEWALGVKKPILTPNTYKDYEFRLNQFLKWCESQSLDFQEVGNLKRRDVLEFLNGLMQKNSAKTRNNSRIVLSSLFSVLKENEMVSENFIETIGVEKTKSVRHKTYSTKQIEKLFEKISEKDPQLFLFVKFVAYNFLRPIEVCRLTFEDLKLDENPPYLEVRAKNKLLKTKLIPSILIPDIPKGTGLIFPTNSKGIETAETNRRDYFSKKFLAVKKEMNFGEEYTMYSFRHTFITKLYRELRKTKSKLDTESTLMQITGHSTLKALHSYLRDLDVEIAEDYSHLLK